MEWKEKLHANLQDELGDVVKYSDYAKASDGATRQMFHDMAKEEMEHACSLWHMMECEKMTGMLNKEHIFKQAREAFDKV
jgi:rubrerythrin